MGCVPEGNRKVNFSARGRKGRAAQGGAVRGGAAAVSRSVHRGVV